MIDFSEVEEMNKFLEQIVCENFECKKCQYNAGTKICPKSVLIQNSKAVEELKETLEYWNKYKNERKDNS